MTPSPKNTPHYTSIYIYCVREQRSLCDTHRPAHQPKQPYLSRGNDPAWHKRRRYDEIYRPWAKDSYLLCRRSFPQRGVRLARLRLSVCERLVLHSTFRNILNSFFQSLSLSLCLSISLCPCLLYRLQLNSVVRLVW